MIWLADLVPIGSVVLIDERRFVVMGHRMTRDGEGVAAGYVLVPYPLGFADTSSLAVVPASRVDEVVAEGFSNEAGTAHLEELDGLAHALAEIPYSEYESGVQLLREFAEKGGAHA